MIAIVGQTASGKSALAIDLARRFDGEIICADSRTVYKGMDIGTAKPSKKDRQEVVHHLLDVATPDQRFTAADFKRLATAAISDISSRGKLPILVGGTGLYVDAVLYDFSFRPPGNEATRQQLEALTTPQLQARLREKKIPLPNNALNRRHLIRALETDGQTPARQPLRPNTLLIGLDLDLETLKQRITERADAMIEAGLIEEVKRLMSEYGQELPAFAATSYRPFIEYLNGAFDLQEAKAQFIKNDVALAKRQKTWFKRNKSIQWVSDPLKAVDIATTFLYKS